MSEAVNTSLSASTVLGLNRRVLRLGDGKFDVLHA